MPNSFLPINPNTSPSNAMAQINQNFAKLDNEAVTKVFKGPNGTESVIQGRLPGELGYGVILSDTSGTPLIYMAVNDDGQPILKVAKEGKDATTGADNDLIFDSARNILRVVDNGSTTLTHAATGGFYSTTVSHTLGSIPAVIAYARNTVAGSAFSMLPLVLNSVSGTAVSYKGQVNVHATTTEVEFQVFVDNSVAAIYAAGTWEFTYYLLNESITS